MEWLSELPNFGFSSCAYYLILLRGADEMWQIGSKGHVIAASLPILKSLIRKKLHNGLTEKVLTEIQQQKSVSSLRYELIALQVVISQ